MVFSDKSVGYVNVVKEERLNADCESKTFPTWLNGKYLRTGLSNNTYLILNPLIGYFLKQSCGAIGSLDAGVGERVTHMFDCLGMVANFRINEGNAKYSNKYES